MDLFDENDEIDDITYNSDEDELCCDGRIELDDPYDDESDSTQIENISMFFEKELDTFEPYRKRIDISYRGVVYNGIVPMMKLQSGKFVVKKEDGALMSIFPSEAKIE